MLDNKRILAMVKGLEQIVAQEDPIGEMVNMKKRPNGLALG
jgi:glutamate-5-semialdehyde dehydrogenase